MVETLFFKIHQSYLLGQLKDTRMYYDMLRQEYRVKKPTEDLTKKQLLTLKKIKIALDTGELPAKTWVENEAEYANYKKEKTEIKQVELVEKIGKEYTNQMRALLGSDQTFYLYNIEHPCGSYGIVDMVYSDQTTVYPLEVKRHEGRHDLLGQILKYELYFNLRMNYKIYESVQPVTLCGSYEEHTLKELKRYGVTAIMFDIDSKEIKLRKL